MKIISIICALLLLSLTLTVRSRYVEAETVIVFDHNNGLGESTSINVQSCTTLPRGWAHRISSLQLQKSSCVELHASSLCVDAEPMIISNTLGRSSLLVDLSGQFEFNDKTVAISKCSFVRRSSLDANDAAEDENALDQFTIFLYEFINKKGAQASIRVNHCKAVLPPLYRNVASIDPRGNCVKLYAGPFCTGEFVQIQPTDIIGSSNLHYSNFLDKTSSVSRCSEYQQLALQLHNKLRTRHYARPLTLNEDLNQEAQFLAETLANQKQQPGSLPNGILLYTTNPVESNPNTGNILTKAAISFWYTNPVTLTKLTSPLTREFGIGYATSSLRAVVVAKYLPLGELGMHENSRRN